MNNHIVLAIFWVVYYAFHSALATRRAKRILGNTSVIVHANYRLLYSIFAAVNFALLFRFQGLLSSPQLFAPKTVVNVGALFLGLVGALVSIGAIRQYPLRFWFKEAEIGEGHLVVRGLNRYMRHPIYSGFIFLTIAFFLWQPYLKHFLFLIITMIYVLVSIRWEEMKLLEEYGDAYQAYRRRVKALIPYVF